MAELTAQEAYDQFWPKTNKEINDMELASLKHQELPLARIKKVFFAVMHFCRFF